MIIRRGPFAAGERVQLTDPRGRKHTIILTAGETFHTHRGSLRHDDLIGLDAGSVVTTTAATSYVAMRPRLVDFVMSMPRGAAVIYPKDAAQIVTFGDIFPGARVMEAGVGSGALTLSLLQAVGPSGWLHSVERRSEFADVAAGNVEAYFGHYPPQWYVSIGDVAGVMADTEAGTIDRVVFDMLAPWENLVAADRVLAPGGVLTCYVATIPQVSRLVEEIRATNRFTEPQTWESTIRDWHVDALAVRPEHRMVGHTGFLITTRTMAPGVTPPRRRTRPAPTATDADAVAAIGWSTAEFTDDSMGVRSVSDRKLRRLARAREGDTRE